jgi:L-threonylcarbamoyladenylate synthase
MRMIKINPDQPDHKVLHKAADTFKDGKIIIHPTETVYGIAGIYSSEQTQKKISSIKRRPPTQPFSIMVNGLDDVFQISGAFEGWVKSFLALILPDAITVLLPRKKLTGISFWDQFPLLGFRFPRHHLSNLLVAEAGEPIVSTSANLKGDPPPSAVEDIQPEILKQDDLVLDGGYNEAGVPSTIIKIDTERKKLQLVRPGAVAWRRIQNMFVE